jgi:fructose-bisphosphate aldolase class I
MDKRQELIAVARALVATGKGILAADESSRTIKRRFDAIGVKSTADTRRDYRELLFRTKDAGEFISGVILHDETIRQNAADGTPLVKVLRDEGIIPGIKVDMGTSPLAGAQDERVTEGLDGLRERFIEYGQLGARFSKWRAVISIGRDIPSAYCIEVNAHTLARYAAQSQEAGFVPIIEPEVIMDGDHSIDRSFGVTRATLLEVFWQLSRQGVDLECTLLKPNMILSGSRSVNRASPEEVARYTVTCLKETVPAAIPGVVFLSGGQSGDEATKNLDAINRHAAEVKAPWELSFSFSRGLQTEPQQVWSGKAENISSAQSAYYQRARAISAARQGSYDPTASHVGAP